MTYSKRLVGQFLTAWFVLCAFSSAVALGAVERDLVEKLNFSNYQADFTHKVFNADDELIEQGHGSIKVLRPSFFDWQLLAPHRVSMVNDGRTIWSYDHDLEQVVTYEAAKSLQGTPLALLSENPAVLIGDYSVETVPCISSQAVQCYKLTTATNDQQIVLGFKQGLLVHLTLTDGLMQNIIYTFEPNLHPTKLQAKNFRFKPPKNVDIMAAS